MIVRLSVFLAVCCGIFMLSLTLFAAETPTTPLQIAVPVEKPVIIDGNLAEWDSSVKVGPVTFDEEVADIYNGTFRVMYDKDYLYASAVVVEPHPPYNTYPTRGIQQDNADEVIIRMSGNPNLTVPVTMSEREALESKELFILELWRNHLTRETVWKGRRGLSFVKYIPPKELSSVKAVVKPASDGKGYTLEARIPWNVVNPEFHPKQGDKLIFLWEIIIASDNPAEPRRAFQIFANGATVESFRNPGHWGGQILLK